MKKLDEADAERVLNAVLGVEKETQGKVHDARNLIQELLEMTQVAEGEMNKNELQKRYENAQKKIQILHNEEQHLEEKKEIEQKLLAQLQTPVFTEKKKRLKHTEQLFRTITGISWRNSSQSSINGLISYESTQTVRRFSFDSPSLLNNQIALANALWDIIEDSN